MTYSEQKIIYGVKSNSDLSEGRGNEYIKHLCESKSTAIRLAKGQYVQGSDAPVVPVTALFHNNLWYFPGGLVIPPSDEDIDLDNKRAKEEALALRTAEVIQKAIDLGMTQDDIDILMGKTSKTGR